jgi:hypothetical protein
MNGRHLAEVKQFRELEGVDSVILALGAKDQAYATRVRDQNPMGYFPKSIVECSVTERRLVANVERPVNPGELLDCIDP